MDKKLRRFLEYLVRLIECKICLKQKIATEFYLSDLKHGLNICNICKTELKKTKRPDRIKRDYIKKIIKEEKLKPCMDCNEVFSTECMDFDHRRGIKKFEISRAYRLAGTPNACIDEIKKCDLVCANCHRQRTQKTIIRTNRVTKRTQISQFIRELKHEKACMDCNQVYPYWVLDFDHRIIKHVNISLIASKKHWGMERVLSEINRCDIICANCHRLRTSSKRYEVIFQETQKIPAKSLSHNLVCSKCGLGRDKVKFGLNRITCNSCKLKADKIYKLNKKTKFSEIKRKNRQEMKQFIECLRQGSCIDCSISSDDKQLQFTPKNGVEFVEVFKMNTWSKNRVLKKLKEYDLICRSCSGRRKYANSESIRATIKIQSLD